MGGVRAAVVVNRVCGGRESRRVDGVGEVSRSDVVQWFWSILQRDFTERQPVDALDCFS